jgi:uncharacterized repeat protein (TIGR01451 family)
MAPLFLTMVITGSSLATGQPDLSFQGGIEVFGGGSEPYDPDEVLTLSVVVVNTGDASAENVDVQLLIDGQVDKVQTLRAVNNGSDDIKTVIFTWAANEGSHRIEVVLDPDEEVMESDEGNNELHMDIEVGGGPSPEVVTETSTTIIPSFILIAGLGMMVLLVGAAVVVGVILLVYFASKR